MSQSLDERLPRPVGVSARALLVVGALLSLTAAGCHKKPAAGTCASDADCDGAASLCVFGQCALCAADADCASGEACEARRCVALAPVDDGACAAGTEGCAGAPEAAQGASTASALGTKEKGARCDEAIRVPFAFDSALLEPTAQEELAGLARCLTEDTARLRGAVVIEGHADERGTAAYNLALGEQRARAVARYLIRLGVPEERVRTLSFGEERPLVAGQGEDAWSANRRGEIRTDG